MLEELPLPILFLYEGLLKLLGGFTLSGCFIRELPWRTKKGLGLTNRNMFI
jgi:hypothetical protein